MNKNKIYHEDCMETMDRMIDSGVKPTIVVTSPPYNVGAGRYRGRRYTDYDDFMEHEDYFNEVSKWINKMLEVTEYHVFFNIQEVKGNKGVIRHILNNHSHQLKDTWIWTKLNPPCMAVSESTSNGYEYIFCFSNNRPETKSFADYRNFTNRKGPNGEKSAYLCNRIISGVNSGKGNNLHGFAFPEHIPEYFIKHFTKPGDLVYDPFMGSGTTAVSALTWGRDYIGSDLGGEYIETSVNRIADREKEIKEFPDKYVMEEHFLESYD